MESKTPVRGLIRLTAEAGAALLGLYGLKIWRVSNYSLGISHTRHRGWELSLSNA
jgi:hypothetical protein